MRCQIALIVAFVKAKDFTAMKYFIKGTEIRLSNTVILAQLIETIPLI